jgi:hypothetical protein
MQEPKRLRCPVCHKRFTPSRSDAVTCSPACRQKAYRRRQKPPTCAAAKRPTKPKQTKRTRSCKGTRGGAGRGQGRKQVLTYMQKFLVGATCEELWQQLEEQKARAEHRNQPHVKRIREEQAQIIRFRRYSPIIRETIREVFSEDFDEILDDARRDAGRPTPKFKRLVPLSTKRPYGKREQVEREAIRWVRRT